MGEIVLESQGQGQFGGDIEVNQRREERRVVNIPATIFSTDGKWAIGTTIVDQSQSGAKLKVVGDSSLPKVILVADFRNNTIFECEVRWRQSGHVGVQVVDVFGPARRRHFFASHAAPKP